MYHVRAICPITGTTIRQLTVNFPTYAAAKQAAIRADRQHGDSDEFPHQVCESLEPTDPRNKPHPETKVKPGYFVAVDPDANTKKK